MITNRAKRLLLISASCGVLFTWTATATAHHTEGDATFQSVATHSLPGGAELNGAGLLWRTRHAVWARLSPTGLDAEHGYTVWWIIFNNPENCVDAEPNVPGSPSCGLVDLGRPSVDPAVFYAGGFVSGPSIDGDLLADGSPNVTLHLAAGDVAEGIDVLVEGQGAGGNGLNTGNGFGAEIHMIIRSHEPISDGSVDEQIGTFAGLCGAGLMDCEDQQAVAFTPNPPE